jgi:hypothetical protein
MGNSQSACFLQHHERSEDLKIFHQGNNSDEEAVRPAESEPSRFRTPYWNSLCHRIGTGEHVALPVWPLLPR